MLVSQIHTYTVKVKKPPLERENGIHFEAWQRAEAEVSSISIFVEKDERRSLGCTETELRVLMWKKN
jgi:hypothetical protein